MKGGRAPDLVSLTWGLALAGLGLLLLLDATDAIALSAGWIGAAVCATLGVVLCASGLGSRRP